MSLFADENTINLPNAKLLYFSGFYSEVLADSLMLELKDSIEWQEYDIKVFGKTYKQPRLTAFYNNSGYKYGYSNLELDSNKLTPTLKSIADKIEARTGYGFNSVLLNYYRDGKDSNGWHADNEKSLGQNPVIASLTFGEERPFYFKHNTIKDESHKIFLENGSLLIMAGEMQHYYKHQIAKTRKNIGERLNLTFRTLKY